MGLGDVRRKGLSLYDPDVFANQIRYKITSNPKYVQCVKKLNS